MSLSGGVGRSINTIKKLTEGLRVTTTTQFMYIDSVLGRITGLFGYGSMCFQLLWLCVGTCCMPAGLHACWWWLWFSGHKAFAPESKRTPPKCKQARGGPSSHCSLQLKLTGERVGVLRLWFGSLDWVTVASVILFLWLWCRWSCQRGLRRLIRCSVRYISSAEIIKCYCTSIPLLRAEFNSGHQSAVIFYLDAEGDASETVTGWVIDSSASNGTALAGQCS